MNWFKKWFSNQPTEAPTSEAPIRKTKEPYVDVKGTVMKDGQIRLEVDYNPEFVDALRRAGFTGADDDQIVHKYIAVMHANLMAEQRGNGNEFK